MKSEYELKETRTYTWQELFRKLDIDVSGLGDDSISITAQHGQQWRLTITTLRKSIYNPIVTEPESG